MKLSYSDLGVHGDRSSVAPRGRQGLRSMEMYRDSAEIYVLACCPAPQWEFPVPVEDAMRPARDTRHGTAHPIPRGGGRTRCIDTGEDADT